MKLGGDQGRVSARKKTKSTGWGTWVDQWSGLSLCLRS